MHPSAAFFHPAVSGWLRPNKSLVTHALVSHITSYGIVLCRGFSAVVCLDPGNQAPTVSLTSVSKCFFPVDCGSAMQSCEPCKL